jgi:hypothetical protein
MGRLSRCRSHILYDERISTSIVSKALVQRKKQRSERVRKLDGQVLVSIQMRQTDLLTFFDAILMRLAVLLMLLIDSLRTVVVVCLVLLALARLPAL